MSINFTPLKSLQGIILLLIIFFFGIIIISAYINSHASANDQKRISDMSKIQAGLTAAYSANGFYPASINGEPDGIETYLDFWPAAPKPNGQCTVEQNSYDYSQQSNGSDYSVQFCLGKTTGSLAAGMHTLTSKEIR